MRIGLMNWRGWKRRNRKTSCWWLPAAGSFNHENYFLRSCRRPDYDCRLRTAARAWPGNERVPVCFSFDVDHESYLLARGETSPTTALSGEAEEELLLIDGR